MMAIPRLRSYERPSLLSYGFRPFFLFGSIYAGTAVLLWILVFYGEISITTAFTPRDWQVHEMLFGYVAAVVTGFLLTAIPNWTGRLPIQGTLDLGLVYGAPQTAARIEVALTMTSRYCPLGEMLLREVKEALQARFAEAPSIRSRWCGAHRGRSIG
jgi:uncharacterized protein involved in response to NO